MCLILEVSYPSSLLSSVIEDSVPKIILTKGLFGNLLDGQRLIYLDKGWYDNLKTTMDLSLKNELKTKNYQLDDLATITYSSGTTGKPKGAFLFFFYKISTIFTNFNSSRNSMFSSRSYILVCVEI